MKNKGGFSFIEVIIAVFIFVLIMTAVSLMFTSLFSGYKNAKAIQKDLESAQFAMNLMAKNLRTSSIVSNGGTSDDIKFYNYSDGGKCISYKLAGSNKIQVASAPDPGDLEPDKLAWCTSKVLSYSDLTSTNSTYINKLSFYAVLSDGVSAAKVVGKVTISMEICATSNCSGTEKDKARIQTTVSLRDYQETMP
ncbi:MAG: prepilin-type N-terminal cleavage/methylation domain-containing protein [Patescibacteria group bacterium]